MSRPGRTTRLPLVAAMMMLAVACTSESSSDGGEEAASCAYRVLYQDRTYRDVANVEFAAGEKRGSATIPPCEDTGGQERTRSPERQPPPARWTASLPKWPSPSVTAPTTPPSWLPTRATSSPSEIQELIDGS
ncbi:DUF6281 family protein [Streptomyces sp. NPDC057199]|uniref:DUF6281 family protein n=1 Tax=Streptomyces sp. NPDC057199 TaxID=3346047 RepID=UPI0036388897